MMRDELAARLLHTFLEELDEQVRILNSELLRLEREGASAGTEPLDAVFRVAHTLKGAARATRLAAVEELCHAMEVPLAEAKRAGRQLAAADIQLLFAAADALGATGERLRSGAAPDAAALGTLTRRIGASASRHGSIQALTTPAYGAKLHVPFPVSGSRGDRPAEGDEGAAGAPPDHADGMNEGASASRASTSDLPTTAAAPPHDTIRSSDDEPERLSDSVAVRAETQVRIRAEKLDELLATAGEVMLAGGSAASLTAPSVDLAQRAQRTASRARRATSRLRRVLESAGAAEGDRRLLSELADEAAALARDAHLISLHSTRAAGAVVRASDELLEGVRRLRLRPFEEAVEALPRVVRDLAAETERQVTLRITGGEVEADRAVLDGLREAIMHLVRNAVDHGIESPEDRLRAGKPANGTVTLSASLRGQHRLRVSVRDDGRGIDLAAAAELAHRRGRPVPADPRALINLLFESGMSTRASTTEISGRGVGLDVVRSLVRRLRGTISVESQPGEGTSFIIDTPLTLATQRALLTSVSGQLFAVPSAYVAGVRAVDPEELRHIDGQLMLPAADGAIPVAMLASVLGPPLVASEKDGKLPAVLVRQDGERKAFFVDELIDEMEIVVRPLDIPETSAQESLAGVALLPSGRIALVLSVASLLQRASGADPAIRVKGAARAPARRVLVVDDSITTRTLEASVLEAAGYHVTTAVDGRAAWNILQDRGADLVLSDVQMPNLDGYQLCELIRSSPKYEALPVILVTSLESPEQRRRGLEAGADAYIVKSSFDQEELLDTVRQLTGQESTE
ncbi:MAG TPA: response regulator [Gemmatimonadales bacterium]|nr:response regulator [Gemmatimonadales bacterium]